jgi:hypothetical protein
MSSNTESRASDGLVIDTSLLVRTIQYYIVIGVGLGLLGIVLLLQFGGGGGIAGGIITGIISIIILSFAVLSGPLIAAFIGYATAGSSFGSIKQRCINSGIANGIGFAAFGIVVATILFIGLTFAIGGSGGSGGGVSSGSASSGSPLELGKLITLITLMIIPNSLVGGAITFFIESNASPQQTEHEQTAAPKQSGDRSSVSVIDEYVTRRSIGVVVTVIIILSVGFVGNTIVNSGPESTVEQFKTGLDQEM